MPRLLLALLAGIIYSPVLQAQTIEPSVVNAAGGTGKDTAANYIYEWNVGESTSVSTFSSTALLVTAGVLQPGTETTGNGNTSGTWGPEEIKVLPNPVVTQLEVDILSKQKGTLSILLLDATGKTVTSRQLNYTGNGSIQKIDFSQPQRRPVFFKGLTGSPAGLGKQERRL